MRKAHQTQFPETPLFLTISVTRLGVSVEKVVATIDTPNNHHGIFRPERKNSLLEEPALLETHTPIKSEMEKKLIMIAQSRLKSSIFYNLNAKIIINL
jgi:hypothetical protein